MLRRSLEPRTDVVLPNMRLKLAAPRLNESGERSACGVVELPL